MHKIKGKYVILIGRRQPAHQGHLDCILDVWNQGAIPVIFLGSANDSANLNYNPIDNPLTKDQLIRQMEFLAKQEGFEDSKIITIADFGNAKLWVREVVDLIEKNFPNRNLNQFLFHFFPKKNQKNDLKKDIKPLNFYVDIFQEYGIEPLIFVGNEESKNLTSSDFRNKNVNSIDFGKVNGENKIPYRSQIIDFANDARRKNNKNGFTEILSNIDVTMMDLTLNRLVEECGFMPDQIKELVKKDKNFVFEELSSSIHFFIAQTIKSHCKDD
ncbi:MAG: nicotinamide mononucleotide adenylyltransferase [Myxococcota bacterium]|jgi:nicotinamide mononucleotide adenylyltransferase